MSDLLQGSLQTRFITSTTQVWSQSSTCSCKVTLYAYARDKALRSTAARDSLHRETSPRWPGCVRGICSEWPEQNASLKKASWVRPLPGWEIRYLWCTEKTPFMKKHCWLKYLEVHTTVLTWNEWTGCQNLVSLSNPRAYIPISNCPKWARTKRFRIDTAKKTVVTFSRSQMRPCHKEWGMGDRNERRLKHGAETCWLRLQSLKACPTLLNVCHRDLNRVKCIVTGPISHPIEKQSPMKEQSCCVWILLGAA